MMPSKRLPPGEEEEEEVEEAGLGAVVVADAWQW